MRSSAHSYRPPNLFRYCCALLSSFSHKTLNPQILNSVVTSIPQSTISSLRNSLTESFSLFFSELYPLRRRSSVSNSSSRSYSFFCFRLFAIQKEQSSKCVSNPYLPIKNHFSVHSSSWWFSSRSKIEPRSRYEHQSFCCFSSGRPKIRSLKHSFFQSVNSFSLSKHGSYYIHRCFTVSSSNGTKISGPVVESEIHSVANISYDQQKLEKWRIYPPDIVFEVVDILRNNGEDLESRLNMLSSRLSVYSIIEIFKVLNTQRISGLRLFEWIWRNNLPLRRNSNICSLIIDNFGRLDNYETMFAWLKTFTSEKISLTHVAFEFLPILLSTNTSLNESTRHMVDLLNKVGGSCRNSGVYGLIEMFCKSDLFEMARYVIAITESKQSYYCLMLLEKCKNGLIEDAYSIIREMQTPNTTVYNYLLGILWRNEKTGEAFALFNEMKAFGIHPNAITFEILINFVCKLGKMDDARQLLDEMLSQGLEPRPTTHALIVKTLFVAEKYEEAHKHVVDKTSSNMTYSLLANLYRDKGDVMSAREVLVEMMEKCLKPNFSVYIKIVKQLRRIGRGNLARDLERRHSKFVIKSRG